MLPIRLGLMQRVFPAYRAAFFDMLAAACTGGLSVFAGAPMPGEALGQEGALRAAKHVPARNLYAGAGPLLLVWQRGLVDWLEDWQPDVLITDANPRSLSAGRAARWMHERGRPVIGWGLGAPPGRGPLAALLRGARRRFLRQFDALITYSSAGAQQFAAAGFAPERIFVAPNAVTPRPTRPPPARPEGYANGVPTVLFVGRLQARKRVDSLLRACAALPGPLRPRLIVAGGGPERPALEAAARQAFPGAVFSAAQDSSPVRPGPAQAGLFPAGPVGPGPAQAGLFPAGPVGPGVIFTGDARGPALDALFAAADLFVLPGTGGLAVQQAMAHALPVMVAEADGTQANLVRPANGWLLPPGDEQALAGCLREALSDPARLRRMGAESYRIAAEEVNLEAMAAVFERAIRFVMEERG